MNIAAYTPFSLSDYPGKISAILFTPGCNFKCPYCHNPGLIRNTGESKIAVATLLSFLEKRKNRLQALVISGGEPTLQKGLDSFIREVRDLGYAIKLDTNGSHPEVLESLFKAGLLDYVAMDIKGPFHKYNDITGCEVDLDKIKQSIHLIKNASGVRHEFRTTVVKSQLSIEDIMACAQMIKGADHYVLQRFKNTVCLEPSFQEESTYSDAAFQQIYQEVAPLVKSCEIR